MRKEKIFFHPIDGSGSLTISWTSGPKGDAIEAKKGAGVGFFSDKGDLLCVIFDEVKALSDQQTLEFSREKIKVTVTNGRIAYTISENKKTPPAKKKKHFKKTSKSAKSSRSIQML